MSLLSGSSRLIVSVCPANLSRLTFQAILPRLTFFSLFCPDYPPLAVCPGCPILAVLCQFCPAPTALSLLSCCGILSSLYCLGWPDTADLSGRAVHTRLLAVLSALSCPVRHALDALSRSSYLCCPVPAVVPCLLIFWASFLFLSVPTVSSAFAAVLLTWMSCKNWCRELIHDRNEHRIFSCSEGKGRIL